ncbi:MAG: DUF1501 domain-containing protein [Alphaproteobacteria bacterium]
MAARPRLLLADAPTESRLVVVILRGAMDGLSAVPPVGDPAYRGLRGDLAIDDALPLDGFFGLHPALAPLAGWYAEGALLPVHAVATPYRERSHFDAQDLLENGTGMPHGAGDGWLNRALAAMGATARPAGLAIAQSAPLILRGAAPVTTWSPSVLPGADDDLMARIAAMYADDPLFRESLESAMALGDAAGAGSAGGGARAQLAESVRTAGMLLAQADGPRIAVLELGGWDTHANQGAGNGRLATALTGLAEALSGLRTSASAVWARTCIAAVTEFGRTAVPNGTRGTDHGTGAAMLLAGGAVAGGRVLADWPGLGTAQLYEGRDLMPTTDLRAVLKGVLRDHLGLADAVLADGVFPQSGAVAPLDGLIRG